MLKHKHEVGSCCHVFKKLNATFKSVLAFIVFAHFNLGNSLGLIYLNQDNLNQWFKLLWKKTDFEPLI